MNRYVTCGFLLLFLCAFLSVSSAADVPSPRALLERGRIDDAMVLLRARLEKTPGDAEAANLMCRCHRATANWNDALRLCEQAVRADPKNAEWHLWYARTSGEAADGAGWIRGARLASTARSEFEEAVALAPASSDARRDLAEFYLRAPAIVGGSVEAAARQADAIAASDPSRAHEIRGRVAEAGGDHLRAEKEFHAAIDAAPSSAEAWFELAAWEDRRGHHEDARIAMKKLLEPTMTGTLGVRVDAARLVLDRDPALAAELLRCYVAGTTAEEWPPFVAHTLLGGILEKRGDRAAALDEYRAALSLAGSYAPARAAVARLSR